MLFRSKPLSGGGKRVSSSGPPRLLAQPQKPPKKPALKNRKAGKKIRPVSSGAWKELSDVGSNGKASLAHIFRLGCRLLAALRKQPGYGLASKLVRELPAGARREPAALAALACWKAWQLLASQPPSRPGWQACSARWHLQHHKRKILRATGALNPLRGSHQAASMHTTKPLAPRG